MPPIRLQAGPLGDVPVTPAGRGASHVPCSSSPSAAAPDSFPWPLVRNLTEMQLTAPVTFLVSENGSGKSTLLEGIAAGMDAVAAGRRDLQRDPSLAPARAFAAGFLFVRRRHARTRLFLRAEDVFGFTTRIGEDIGGLDDEARDLTATLPEGYGRHLALGVVQGQRRAFTRDYGDDPDGRSHGETFLHLLHRRLVPNGLNFLDEPETPFSPTRMLALLALLADRVAHGCQFVIATHSPILLALPGGAAQAVAVRKEGRGSALDPPRAERPLEPITFGHSL